MTNLSKGKKIAVFAAIALVVFSIVFLGITLTKNMSKTEDEINAEQAEKKMSDLLNNIKVTKLTPKKVALDEENDSLSQDQELPDISKYPVSVTGNGQINVEIFSSPEKAGTGTDGWLNDVAERFNGEKYTVDGKSISVSIRSVSSGPAFDYISSRKYIPDAITPSNEFWGKMIEESGVKTELKEKKLAGNVAGVLLSKSKYEEINKKYGSVNMKILTQCTASGELAMGYTNPFVSSTGLNCLVSTLCTYDYDDPLSDKAVEGFKTFQENVPFVAYNTLQMRKSAESGSLDAMVMEYQLYVNDPTLSSKYIFTPFGVRHDNPMYALDNLASDKQSVLEKFCEYCLSDSSQKLAKQYGFNQNETYKSEIPDTLSGKNLIAAQNLYKENKNVGRPIIAVFVADTSGSMDGEPINELQKSLINSMKYINMDNYVGLISYNNSVYENLPIAKFDLNQRAFFKGAVLSLDAKGSTATYDALVVAIDMINKAKEQYPDAKPMIFLLSDGAQNEGASLNEVEGIIKNYQIPIYTIGYNANIDALKRVSEINEAATIDASSDDIVYQLKNLFNSEM